MKLNQNNISTFGLLTMAFLILNATFFFSTSRCSALTTLWSSSLKTSIITWTLFSPFRISFTFFLASFFSPTLMLLALAFCFPATVKFDLGLQIIFLFTLASFLTFVLGIFPFRQLFSLMRFFSAFDWCLPASFFSPTLMLIALEFCFPASFKFDLCLPVVFIFTPASFLLSSRFFAAVDWSLPAAATGLCLKLVPTAAGGSLCLRLFVTVDDGSLGFLSTMKLNSFSPRR